MSAQPQIRTSADDAAGVAMRSQVLFRELNEQIRSLADGFGLGTDLDLVCECTNGGCFERITISPEDYEAVRRFPTRFMVKAGHATAEVERIVEEKARFVVVEKIGADAESAIRLDPRRAGARREGIA